MTQRQLLSPVGLRVALAAALARTFLPQALAKVAQLAAQVLEGLQHGADVLVQGALSAVANGESLQVVQQLQSQTCVVGATR